MDDSTDFTCTFAEYDAWGLAALVSLLGGLNIAAETGTDSEGRTTLAVRGIPSAYRAEVMRTRNAGRKRAQQFPPAGSPFDGETACAAFLEWLESHTAAEGKAALGLSHASYYRHLKVIRAAAESNQYAVLGDIL